jgi:TP901 family phage tail tape measure protein
MASAVIIRIIGDVTGFVKSTEQVRAELLKVRAITQTVNAAMSGMKTLIFASAASLIAMVAPVIMATNALKGYEANIRRIAGVTQTSLPEIMKYNKTFSEMAIKYGQSAETITDIAIELGKAGFTVNDIFSNLLEPTLQLATANQMELATAAEIATNAWQLWGDEVGNFAEMANYMHVAANAALLDVEDLAESFQYVGSAAVLNNITFKEFLSLAGGVSQIAARMGESFRSLFINMLTHGEELAETLGHWEILQEGKISLMELVKVLKEGDYTLEQWNAAMELWGLRPATNLAQIRLSAEEIERIFGELNVDMNALPKASELMRMSLSNLMTSIMETLMAPLRTETVFTALTDALTKIRAALADERIGRALQTIILVTSDFLSKHAVQLVQLLTDLLTLFMRMLPYLVSLAKFFLGLASAVAKTSPELLILGFAMYKMISLMPTYIQLVIALAAKTNTMRLSFMAAAVGVGMFLGGMAMIITGGNDLIRILGLIAVAAGAAAMAFAVFNVMKAIGLGDYASIVAMITALGMVTAAVGIALATPVNTNVEAYVPTTPTPYTPTYGEQTTTTYNDNSETNYYGVPTDTLVADIDASGGVVNV